MDDKSGIYNIHLCRICQNPNNLNLISTSESLRSNEDKSCWDMLNYIFCDIIWVEDRLESLVCQTCLKSVYETARFKKLCLETNSQRHEFNNKYLELISAPVETPEDAPEVVETHAQPTQIEEVNLPANDDNIFIKSEANDDSTIANQENQDELLEIVDTQIIPNNNPEVKRKRRETALEKFRNARVKKVKKFSSESVPSNVTIISAKLSEFMPCHNPRSNETICKICQSVFQTSLALRDHIATQHNMIPRRYRCEFCHIGFYTLDEFQCHYKDWNHKDYVPLQCTKCGCKTIRKQSQTATTMQCHCLFSHLLESADKKAADDKNRKILCMHCNACFVTLQLAKDHVAREHVDIRQFNCTRCGFSLLSKKLLEEHIIANHQYRCQACPDIFETADLLQQHRKRFHWPRYNSLHYGALRQPNGLHCILCKRVFPTRTRLAKHIESRACEQYGYCELCGAIFHETRIKRHLVMNHDVELNVESFETYFRRKVMTQQRHRELSRIPRHYEQYRECNLCAKYLHVSQIKTHLVYTHHININEKGFKLQPYFKCKNLSEEDQDENAQMARRNRMHEVEHAYSLKL